MEIGRVSGIEFGQVIRNRREARGLDLAALHLAIGGTPGIGFLASLERGAVGPSSSLVLKLAEVLDLPPDAMLNAAGFATEGQRLAALSSLAVLDVADQRRSDA
ncbi:MAG: helix-turn-helix transcriptional regulator [Candidatus Limnocylindrales bacterium]